MDFLDELFGKRGHHGRKHHGRYEVGRHGAFTSVENRHDQDGHHDRHHYEKHHERGEHHRAPAVCGVDRPHGHEAGDRHWNAELPDDRRWTPLEQLLRKKSFVVLLVAVGVVLLGAIIAIMVVLLPLAGELLNFAGEHGIKGILDRVWSGAR